jgi:peptide/nickel transport system substrate-binding protein
LGIAGALAGMALVAGCGGSSGSTSSTPSTGATAGGASTGASTGAAAPSTAVGDTLTIASTYPMQNLDPAKSNTDPMGVMATELAYAPLIRLGADGKFTPGLAESWKYVGDGNTVFEFTLRDGLKFSDGTPVTAQDAVASINYYKKASTSPAFSTTIGEPKATGPLTVRVTSKGPNPEMPRLMGDLLAGSLISPAGLKSPGKLSSSTSGVGPYTLDPAGTKSGATYTYVANPNYYDQTQIHWKKIVFNTVAGSAAALNAVRGGQADFAVSLDPNDAPAAESAGLKVVSGPAAFQLWIMGNRSAPPLKDERVRQAMNVAINRAAIAKALFGDYGGPTTQIQLPGSQGYSEAFDSKYAYDPAKAKSLLAEAGFPNGFEIKAAAIQVAGVDQMAQAVVSDWAKVGIKVKLSVLPPNQWFTDAPAKKYPLLAGAYGGLPPFLTSSSFLRPVPNPFNPWGASDPEVDATLAEADAAPDATREGLYQKAEEQAIDKGMFAAVARFDTIVAASDKVSGVEVTDNKIIPDVTLVTPAS